MAECTGPRVGNIQKSVDDAAERVRAMTELSLLDAELLVHHETRRLIDLGLEFGKEVTKRYGDPSRPLQASGAYEQDVIMTYHNGGEDGHTSIGPHGTGVPRNVLVIARRINEVARADVVSPRTRAIAFCAAQAHDVMQLCGRALLDEGQGEGRGDELISADQAYDRYVQAGGSIEIARRLSRAVMATAFDPRSGSQNVDRTQWQQMPDDYWLQDVLAQELTAAADLFGATTRRGPLGAIEYCVESMCLRQKDQVLQRRLRALGQDASVGLTMAELLAIIDTDDELADAFEGAVSSQVAFFANYLNYSDTAIRHVCGSGVDELFPGRLENADIMAGYYDALVAGASAQSVWLHARGMAGYHHA